MTRTNALRIAATAMAVAVSCLGCSNTDESHRPSTDSTAATTTATTTPSGPLLIAQPVGDRWRSPVADFVGRPQRFRSDHWPDNVVATIAEADGFLPTFGPLANYTVDRTLGGRTLYRFPQFEGPGERRWAEADGRLWTVTIEQPGAAATPWPAAQWESELAGLFEHLDYHNGRFTPGDPYVDVEPLDDSLAHWNDAHRVWQNGDDRYMVTGFDDRFLDLESVSGRDVRVRGHAGRLDNERLVWREDDNTVVVLGSSIAGFDEVTAADLVGRPWGGAALDPDGVVDVANRLEVGTSEEYGRIPLHSLAHDQANVVVRVTGDDGSTWVRRADGSGTVVSDPAGGADGVALTLRAEDGPVRVWAAGEPYGPRDVPECAVTVDPSAGGPGAPLAVDVGADCVLPSR
ncbi:MAG: hypothetical protein V9G12_03825 [Microthrixaceae bacterium]|jgi:hypothetical protein